MTTSRRSQLLRRNGVCLLILAGIASAFLVFTLLGSGWRMTGFHVGVLSTVGIMAVLALVLLVGSRWMVSADERYLAAQREEWQAQEAERREADRAARERFAAAHEAEQEARIARLRDELDLEPAPAPAT